MSTLRFVISESASKLDVLPLLVPKRSITIYTFLKNFLEDISPSSRATDAPVLDLWVSKPEWAAVYAFRIGVRVSE